MRASPSPSDRWYACANEACPSPALLFYPDRIERNLERMLKIAGAAQRLRPHVKTHKCSELVRLHQRLGIEKFKCATLAEAEMLAHCQAADVLLAFPMIGPAAREFCQLARAFPATEFSTIIDSQTGWEMLWENARQTGCAAGVFLDIDCGMHRTGIAPGPEAGSIYRQMHRHPQLKVRGLHAYDGHIHETNLAARQAQCEKEFGPVETFRRDLEKAGLPVPITVAGGTPTFPIHARRTQVECSPGTTVLWDFSYADRYPDLPFLPAALLLTRVVSKPGPDLLCLDLGYKSVASENPHPRVRFLNLPEADAVLQSEEHLVVRTPRAAEFQIGACLYGLPRHICPTVALHERALRVRNHQIEGECQIDARQRRLAIDD